MREGLKVHFVSSKPCYRKLQEGTKCAETRAKIIKKLDKVRARRYIAPGFVTSLTSFAFMHSTMLRVEVLEPLSKSVTTFTMNTADGLAKSLRNPRQIGELGNLVMSLEQQVRQSGHRDCELFLFTDNTTAKAAFWKGSSKSRKLFELVLRLRTLEIEADLVIHVVHVAGKRLVAQGTDGLSRGDKSTGVMQRISMEQLVPLHQSALQCSIQLRRWLTAAARGLEPIFLEPEDWFTTGQGLGTFAWHPAPAAADIVVEQLGTARQKQPTSLHIVVVPCIMTG
jgi:hypothetical protein